MKILTLQEMEKLTTKRLLDYKNKLLTVSDRRCSICQPGDDCPDIQERLKDGCFIKSSPLWQETYANVKDVLKDRKHLER
jgi:hypothetical protein